MCAILLICSRDRPGNWSAGASSTSEETEEEEEEEGEEGEEEIRLPQESCNLHRWSLRRDRACIIALMFVLYEARDGTDNCVSTYLLRMNERIIIIIIYFFLSTL